MLVFGALFVDCAKSIQRATRDGASAIQKSTLSWLNFNGKCRQICDLIVGQGGQQPIATRRVFCAPSRASAGSEVEPSPKIEIFSEYLSQNLPIFCTKNGHFLPEMTGFSKLEISLAVLKSRLTHPTIIPTPPHDTVDPPWPTWVAGSAFYWSSVENVNESFGERPIVGL